MLASLVNAYNDAGNDALVFGRNGSDSKSCLHTAYLSCLGA